MRFGAMCEIRSFLSITILALLSSDSDDSIQMMSGLVLQLMQSVVQLPEVEDDTSAVDEDLDEEELRRRRKRKVDDDVFIEQSYTQALQVAHNFLARYVDRGGKRWIVGLLLVVVILVVQEHQQCVQNASSYSFIFLFPDPSPN